MTDTKFIPGPWEYFDEDGHQIYGPEPNDGFVVASIVPIPRDEVTEANAHLIAAAPELYEFVQDFVDGKTYGGGLDLYHGKQRAKNLLAKARGDEYVDPRPCKVCGESNPKNICNGCHHDFYGLSDRERREVLAKARGES